MTLPRFRAARLVAALLVAPVAFAPMLATPAHAQWTVFDPSNYAQNVLTAARSLQQVTNQITSLQNEAQMLINQARNLTSLPTSMLSQIEGNFSEVKSLLGQAERLAYSVQDIESQFASTYRDFAADKTGEQLVTAARERWQESLSAYEHSLKAGATAVSNIEGTQVQTRSLVGASQSATGALQATQAGNQLLALQAQQLADLTAVVTANGRAQALQSAEQAAAAEQGREQRRRFLTPGAGYQPGNAQMFYGNK